MKTLSERKQISRLVKSERALASESVKSGQADSACGLTNLGKWCKIAYDNI